jgi:hypothetical protein
MEEINALTRANLTGPTTQLFDSLRPLFLFLILGWKSWVVPQSTPPSSLLLSFPLQLPHDLHWSLLSPLTPPSPASSTLEPVPLLLGRQRLCETSSPSLLPLPLFPPCSSVPDEDLTATSSPAASPPCCGAVGSRTWSCLRAAPWRSVHTPHSSPRTSIATNSFHSPESRSWGSPEQRGLTFLGF